MKKLLFSFFVLTVSFLSSANDAMAVLGECVDRDGNLVISALGKTGDATFEDEEGNDIGAVFTYSGGYLGENDDADANHCNAQPDEYKVKFFKTAICTLDPFKVNADPDFSSCIDIFNNGEGKDIIITKGGADVSLLEGDLAIPLGEYPYLVVVVSNHLRIKHQQKFVNVLADNTRAVMYGNGDTGTNTNTDLCYTVDTVTTYSGHTYNSAYLSAQQANHGSAFSIIASQAGADTSTLKCTSDATPGADFDFATEIIDHMGDFNTGLIASLDYESNDDPLIADIEMAATMLQNDNASVATHENNAQRIAGFFKYDNPIMISEATEGFKLNFATTQSVSIDSSQDMGNNKIWMVKVGADPFTVKVETQTKRSRGAWR